MDDNKIISTANAILAQLTVPRRVKTIEDLNADMFVTLYEGLCGESIPDLILPANSDEDEVHNMQCVIDSLAMDILHTSLAHIVGQDVVKGRRMSVINLLDIFSGLLEYILDGIEKEETSSADGSSELDAGDQSVLSDAISRRLKDKTNVTAEGDKDRSALSSPTASPNNKKSRRSGEQSERRRSKKATPHAVSQPIASSSMQSINPSCTESESDASTKPSAGRALAFSKVPAEHSPTANVQATGSDVTFTKPYAPPERTLAHKLADDILRTGESTEELIALADTPDTRPRTRSATKQLVSGAKSKDSNSDECNQSNNATRSRASKRSRQPKRHVSFVSDRTLNNDDTLAGITTHLDEPRRVASEPLPTAAQVHSPRGADRLNLSNRLVDYFDDKVANGAGDCTSPSSRYQTATERSPPTHSSEFQTAMEKSASLYDRVKALRNAASDKLESLKSDSIVEGAAGDMSTTEYYLPTTSGARCSDYARGVSLSQSTASRYQTARDSSPTASASVPTLTVTRNLTKSADMATDYTTARQQTNVPDIGRHKATPSSTAADAQNYRYSTLDPSSHSYVTAKGDHSESYSTGRDPLSDSYGTGRDPISGTYGTGRDPISDTYGTGRDPISGTYGTGRDPLSDTYGTGRDPISGTYGTGRDPISGTYGTGRDPISGTHGTGRDPISGTYGTGRDPLSDTYGTGRDPISDTYGTGRDPISGAYGTGRNTISDIFATGSGPISDKYATGRDPISDKYETGSDLDTKAYANKGVIGDESDGCSTTEASSAKVAGYRHTDMKNSDPYFRGRPVGVDTSIPEEEETRSGKPLRFIVDKNGRSSKDRRELLGYKRPNWRPKTSADKTGKKVHFTRSSASGAKKQTSQTVVDAVRKTLDEEKWREKIQEKLLTRQYREDLTDMVEAHREQLEEEKSAAAQQDKQFTSNIQRLADAYGDKPLRSKPVYSARGFLLPKSRVLKKRPARKSESKTSVESKPSKSLDPEDDDFLPNLMEEFPHLYLAPETIQKMWMKHQKQSATVSKCMEEEKRKKSKAQATIEDAERRQALLMGIMQKELDHTKRLKQLRDKENADIESRRKQRDVRVQSARVKKYYDEYSTRMKASMLKNKTKEEQLFKRLFAEGLKVQKERMQVLRGYAKEQREKRAHKQAVDVQALENFYKDQFGMLAESVVQERKNVEVRDAAQAQVLNKMKMQLRKKMECDIKDFQEQLKRDDDDYYFRELDAEKVVQQLHMTRYQTGL